MSAHDRIRALRQDGQVEAAGEFQLDPEKAREKLQSFQLEDPHHYVLECVQVAHLLGATAVHVQIEAARVAIRFDGAPLPRRALENVYAAVFLKRVDDETRAMRHLGIGVVAAQALRPRRVRVETGGAAGFALELRGSQEIIEDDVALETPGTCIIVERAWDTARLSRFLRQLSGVQAEEAILRRDCALSPLPIHVNGEQINPQGMWLEPVADDPFLVERAFANAHEHGKVALRRRGTHSTVHILQHGVLVATHHLPTSLVTLHAVVDSRRLNKNLSQSAFVEDEAWHTLFRVVLREQLHAGLLEVVRAQLALPHDARDLLWLDGVAEMVLREVGDWRQARASGKHDDWTLPQPTHDLARTLEAHPMWALADKAPDDRDAPGVGHREDLTLVSTARLSNMPKGAPLAISSLRRADLKHRDIMHVLWTGIRAPGISRHVDPGILGRYMGRQLKDVRDELRALEVRQANEARWLEHVFEGMPRVKPHRVLAELPFDLLGGPFHGTLRIERANVSSERDGGWHGDVWLVKGGRLLKHLRRVELPLPGMSLVFDGPQHETLLFDDVERDETLLAQAHAALDAIARALAQWTEALVTRNTPLEALELELLDRWLEGMANATIASRLLLSLGLDPQHPKHLAWLGAHHKRADLWHLSMTVPHTFSAPARKKRLGALGHLPLLERMDGTTSTIGEAFDELASRRTIAVVEAADTPSDEDWRDAALDVPVWRLSERSARMLATCIPRRVWVDTSERIRRAAIEARFMRKPTEEARLRDHERALLVIPIAEAGADGELALMPPDGQLLSKPTSVRARLLLRQRHLTNTEVNTPAGRYVATLTHDKLTPNATWSGLGRGGMTSRIPSLLTEHAARALAQWALRRLETTPPPEGHELLLLWQATGALVATRRLHEHTSATARDLLPDETLAHALANARIFEATSGRRFAWKQLAGVMQPGLKLHYVRGGGEPIAEVIPTPDTLVLRVPEETTTTLLDTLFPGVLQADITRTDARAKAVERARRAFLARPKQAPIVEGEVLHRLAIEAPGVRGEAGLLARGRNAQIDVLLLHQGRIVHRTQRGGLLPIAAAVTLDVDALTLTPEWDNVVRGPELDAALDRIDAAITPLVQSWVTTLSAQLEADAHAPIPDRARALAMRLAHEARQGRHKELFGALIRLPLCRTGRLHPSQPTPGMVTLPGSMTLLPDDPLPLDALRAHIAPEVAALITMRPNERSPMVQSNRDEVITKLQRQRVIVVSSDEADALAELHGLPLRHIDQVTLALHNAQKALEAREAAQAKAARNPRKDEAPLKPTPTDAPPPEPPQPTEPPQPDPPSPEAALLERLAAHLLAARGPSQELLMDSAINTIELVDRDGPIRVSPARITIPRALPAAQLAMSQPDDLVALAFLASSVYSAINAYYEVITDDHEVRFLHAHAGLLLGR